jgi:hypothetical protein
LLQGHGPFTYRLSSDGHAFVELSFIRQFR